MAKANSVYIDRTKIDEYIMNIGNEQWDAFSATPIENKGACFRCNINTDKGEAILDFYFKDDGSTTITPRGKTIDIAIFIKTALENKYSHKHFETKTHPLKNVSQEWSDKLIDYLKSLDGVICEGNSSNPKQKRFVFTSNFGDKLTITYYSTGTLMLQGKAAYLFREALSFISYCESISLEDIVDTTNIFHNIKTSISDVKNELNYLLPEAYNNIDATVLKILSPSISLRKVDIELEDYSCYTFPALKALEGYVKFLFKTKNVVVEGLGEMFRNNKLAPNIKTLVSDATFQAEVERIFKYFKENRHSTFHAEQNLIETRFVNDKKEADLIVNGVLDIIETSYCRIFKHI